MDNDKKEEIIIMLTGNSIVFPINSDYKDKLIKEIHQSIKESISHPGLVINWGEYYVVAKNIVGWLFRDKIESVQEKQTKIFEKLAKNLEKEIKNSEEGDDWKERN